MFRYRLRDVEVIVKNGISYGAVLVASAALYWREEFSGFLLTMRRRPQWILRIGNGSHRALAQPVVKRRSARSRLSRSLRLSPRAGWLRARLNSDLDVCDAASVVRRMSKPWRRRMALMWPMNDRDFIRLATRLCHVLPSSELVLVVTRLKPVTTLHSTIRFQRPVRGRGVEFWRDHGILLRHCILKASIAVLALGARTADGIKSVRSGL